MATRWSWMCSRGCGSLGAMSRLAPRGRMNDLHYFDIQARKWHEVNVRNAPSERYGHTAVLDTQQRMWIFWAGNFWNSGWLNDVHYFDTKARQWHEVTAKNAADAPVGREGATAVLYGLEMWIFAGYNGGWLNDLHYFDIQAEMWHEVIASNAPSERYSHSAVLDAEQRMWIFGVKGRDDSDSQWVNDLHYFNLKAFNKAA
ncbi:unnamed protein product [Cladocopium goreaui]|uniref:RING finger protein B (Protein rngB) n=1 Tax=Cladocopium goreaui TaxID=2562237 RepID=A0A9P1C486_9DINO|nr:unnamed protein product [Cladocopium goreaui]